MNRIILWVDDVRNPKRYINQIGGEAIWLKSFDDFVSYINRAAKNDKFWPTDIWFDHDLGTDKSGYDCLKYLINTIDELHLIMPAIHSQSANPDGRRNILGLYNSYNKIRL